MIIPILVSCLVSYVLGSYPTAYFIIRLFNNKNVFKNGDGNMGGTNVFFISKSYTTAVITGLVDILKAYIAAALSTYFIGDIWIGTLISGAFSTLGHNYSVFKSFKGGKGASTTAGTILYFSPIMLLVSVLIFKAVSFVDKSYTIIKNEYESTIIRSVLVSTAFLIMLKEYLLHAVIFQGLNIIKYVTEKETSKKYLF